MSRTAKVALAAVVMLVTAGLTAVGPASAYPYTIQIRQVGVKKTLTSTYRNYANRRTVPDEDFDAGKLKVVAVPYKISEGLKKKDQFLLNLTLSRSAKQGALDIGWAQVYVTPLGYKKVSDSAATGDAKVNRSCSSVDLSLNKAFGPISASAKIGSLKSCRYAKVDLTNHSRTSGATGWKIDRLKHLKSAGLELYLQVPRGVRPRWRVSVTTPRDSCRDAANVPPSQCVPRDAEVRQEFIVKSTG